MRIGPATPFKARPFRGAGLCFVAVTALVAVLVVVAGFAAYVGALEEAFTDLIAENPELIAILDEIYAEAVADVYDAQITMSDQ